MRTLHVETPSLCNPTLGSSHGSNEAQLVAKAADVQYSQRGAPNAGLIWKIQEKGTFGTFVVGKFQSHPCLQAPPGRVQSCTSSPPPSCPAGQHPARLELLTPQASRSRGAGRGNGTPLPSFLAPRRGYLQARTGGGPPLTQPGAPASGTAPRD